MAFLIDTRLLADNVRHFRLRRSFTVRQLADLTLLAYGVIEKVESGLFTPTSQQLDRIAHVLGVKNEELVLPRPAERPYFEGC